MADQVKKDQINVPEAIPPGSKTLHGIIPEGRNTETLQLATGLKSISVDIESGKFKDFDSIFISTKKCFAGVLDTDNKKKPWSKFGDWFHDELAALKASNKLNDTPTMVSFYKNVAELLLDDDSSVVQAPAVSLVSNLADTSNILWVTYIVNGDNEDDSKPVSDIELSSIIDDESVFWRYQVIGDSEITRRKLNDISSAGLPVVVIQNQYGKVLRTLKTNDPLAILNLIKSVK